MKLFYNCYKWLLLIIFITLFFINTITFCVVSFIINLLTLLIEPKFRKLVFNWGFLIFVILVLSVPLIIDFSKKQLLENILIVSRGLILISFLYFLMKDISSESFYKKIKKYLPEDIVRTTSLAINILPKIKIYLSNEINNFKKGHFKINKVLFNIFKSIISIADNISNSLEAQNKRNIVIITGKIHQGKSTIALQISNELIAKGIKVSGIISESINESGKRIGYNVINLKTMDKVKLATTEPLQDAAEKIGCFNFFIDGITFAHNSLDPMYLKDSEIVFIDEIGKLELAERGFYKSIIGLLDSQVQCLVLVIRDKYVKNAEEKFNINPTLLIDINNKENQSLSFINDKLISLIRS